jgi:hypothetical protein
MGTVDSLAAARVANDVVAPADHNDVVNALWETTAKWVRAAAVANVAGTYLNGSSGVGATKAVGGTTLSIDGVTLANGDRVLLQFQTTVYENGVYVVSGIGTGVVLTRAVDSDTAAKVSDCFVNVAEGTVWVGTQWRCTASSPTMGTTSLRFRRTLPVHQLAAPGDLWVVGASHTAWTGQPVTQNMPRNLGLGSGGTFLTTTNQWLVGGLVVPAGRAVSNVNCVYSGSGSGSVTIRHAAVLDTATRTVRAHSVNSTALATGEVVTTYAMVTPWTPDYDTPVWVMLSHNQATTLPTIRTSPNGSTAPNLLAPALAAHNGTASSATVPTDGSTVIAAPTTGLANVPYLWLT